MADFYNPNPDIQRPDMLAAYLKGAMSPGMVTGQQQELAQGSQQLQTGQLNLDMLRQMMAYRTQVLQGAMGPQTGAQPTQQGANIGGASGGIQNGPQGGVSSQPQGSGSPLDPLLDPSRIARNAQFASMGAMLTPGGDPNKPIADALKLTTDARADQLNRTKLALAPKMDEFNNIISSSTPERLVMANPDYIRAWQSAAPQLGIDPNDPKAMTPDNVRAAATLGYNHMAAQFGGDPKPMPTTWLQQNVGYGGTQQVNPVTGETKVGLPRELPTGSIEKGVDANGNQIGNFVQTGGLTAGGTSPYSGGGKQGVALPNAAPTTENYKGAQFADYFRTGVAGVNNIEATGYTPSPKARAIMIDAATSEQEGLTHQYLMQLAIKDGLSSQDKQYMSAAFPMLQAIGHDLAGQRLTTAALRNQFESAIPTDVADSDNMRQVQSNRESFQRGLLTQAGPQLRESPLYKNTLGADFSRLQAGNQAPASALAHLKAHPELADQFKAKYGYVPDGK